MNNIPHCLLFSLLITTINLHASDYEYPCDDEYTFDNEYAEFDEPDEFDARWTPIGDIPENPQLPLLIEANHPLEHIICLLDYLTPKVQDDSPIENRLLHIAIKHRHVPLVEELLRRNADVNFRSRAGDTPLHTATNSVEENILIVQKLWQHGANINATDYFGSTPLHHACFNGHRETVTFLLERNADRTINGGISATMDPPHTPAWTATSRGHFEIAKLIDNWTDLPEIKEPDVE